MAIDRFSVTIKPIGALVVCPGSLAEQWQDELYRRFHLKFDILTNDKLESSATGNCRHGSR